MLLTSFLLYHLLTQDYSVHGNESQIKIKLLEIPHMRTHSKNIFVCRKQEGVAKESHHGAALFNCGHVYHVQR